MIDGVDNYWVWIAVGLALAVLEILVPGVYLIWLAAAALITGGLSYLFGFGWPLEIISFVSLALIAVYSARRYLSQRPIVSSDPLLNQRGGRMVGEIALVVAVAGSRSATANGSRAAPTLRSVSVCGSAVTTARSCWSNRSR